MTNQTKRPKKRDPHAVAPLAKPRKYMVTLYVTDQPTVNEPYLEPEEVADLVVACQKGFDAGVFIDHYAVSRIL